jgi:hypothetical protein
MSFKSGSRPKQTLTRLEGHDASAPLVPDTRNEPFLRRCLSIDLDLVWLTCSATNEGASGVGLRETAG